MRKHIENAITKEFTILGLTTTNYMILLVVWSFSIALFPLWLTLILLLVVGTVFYTINKKGRPFYLQSKAVWFMLEKKMTVRQNYKLPKLFKE